MTKAFLNGEFLDLADAKISVFDRGLLFGDGVYEVLPVYNGEPFFLDKHLLRLHSNLEKIKIPAPDIDWHAMIDRLIAENNAGDLQVYIQITRGNQGARKHDIPAQLVPTIIAFTLHTAYPTLQEKEKGLRAKLIEDTRWLRCDIKSTSLLGNILLNDDAVSAGYQTSILVRDGLVTEGSTSNVFVINQAGKIKTPPLDNLCLPGITRQLVKELLEENNIPLYEEPILEKELFAAQEVWITSTTKEVYPITQINNSLIGTGKAGPHWRTIETAYQRLIKS